MADLKRKQLWLLHLPTLGTVCRAVFFFCHSSTVWPDTAYLDISSSAEWTTEHLLVFHLHIFVLYQLYISFSTSQKKSVVAVWSLTVQDPKTNRPEEKLHLNKQAHCQCALHCVHIWTYMGGVSCNTIWDSQSSQIHNVFIDRLHLLFRTSCSYATPAFLLLVYTWAIAWTENII